MIVVSETPEEVVFQLDSGVQFRVSPADKMLVVGGTWTIDFDGYVKFVGPRNHPYRNHRLHLIIADLVKIQGNPDIDHKDGAILNCRQDNLRPATKSQQAANRKRAITNQSGFKGVIARRGKYEARIKKDGKCYYSPSFFTPEEAHNWYSQKANELHGEFARAQ